MEQTAAADLTAVVPHAVRRVVTAVATVPMASAPVETSAAVVTSVAATPAVR